MKKTQFLNEFYNPDTENIIVEGVFIGVLLGAALMIWRNVTKNEKIRQVREKGESKCENLTGQEKEKCIHNVRKIAIGMQITELKNSLYKCNAAKDPQQCKKSINFKIFELKEKQKSYSNVFGF